MATFLARLVPLFMLLGSAYASEPQDLPPQAGMVSVIIFLVLFVGLCVGFVAYFFWKERKPKQGDQELKE
jgi:hypothetical protein